MARQNRVVVSDGIYHITCRTAQKLHLFAEAEFKDRMVTWLHGIADFSGVNIIDYVFMDNHFHIFAAVPPVPERYWQTSSSDYNMDSSRSRNGDSPQSRNGDSPQSRNGDSPREQSARPPCAEAFGMRPPECRAPRWIPDLADERPMVTAVGERLSDAAVMFSVSNGVPPVSVPRPPIGFSIKDDEMIERLSRLYSGWNMTAKKTQKRWQYLREEGKGEIVECEKENLCRRMYNLSQFVKTFKERISAGYKKYVDPTHTGTIWEGRFYSGLVDKEFRSRLLVSAYIDYNPVKAGIVTNPSLYRWGAWFEANAEDDNPRRGHYREMYCNLFGCDWEEAKSRMNAIFAMKVPDACKKKAEEDLEKLVQTMKDKTRMKAKQEKKDEQPTENIIGVMIKMNLVLMKKGAYISFNRKFAREIASQMPLRFPGPSMKSILRLCFIWEVFVKIAA